MMTLATYALKCGVPYEELLQDGIEMLDFLNSVGDEFTMDDLIHSLEAYNGDYITYPIDTIIARTDIYIKKNKRNGRKQILHLKMARSNLEILNEDNGKALQGRPAKANIVQLWQQEHPNGRKVDCIRDTGLSKPTVYKWWE